MFALRRQFRPLTWFALVALLALALLPTLSHALAFARGGSASWAEVCTPQGLRVVASDETGGRGGAPAPMQPAAHLAHCPFCALQGLDAGLPSAQPGALQLPTAAAAAPLLLRQAPHTPHAGRSAQPRGPPAVS